MPKNAQLDQFWAAPKCTEGGSPERSGYYLLPEPVLARAPKSDDSDDSDEEPREQQDQDESERKRGEG